MEHELGNPEWIDTARSFVTLLGAPTSDDALRLLTPDVTYRVLGNHALSGAFTGRDEAARHLAALVRQTEGRIDPIKFVDWMLGLSHVSVLVDVEVEVGSAAQQIEHLILMRFNAADLIDEVIVFFADPEVADRVYGRYLRGAPTPEH